MMDIKKLIEKRGYKLRMDIAELEKAYRQLFQDICFNSSKSKWFQVQENYQDKLKDLLSRAKENTELLEQIKKKEKDAKR